MILTLLNAGTTVSVIMSKGPNTTGEVVAMEDVEEESQGGGSDVRRAEGAGDDVDHPIALVLGGAIYNMSLEDDRTAEAIIMSLEGEVGGESGGAAGNPSGPVNSTLASASTQDSSSAIDDSGGLPISSD